jgi:hypothetical protein
MTTTTLPTIPKVLPVTTGVYIVPDNLTEVDSLPDIRGIFQEVSYLMTLTPERDLEDAEYTENLGWMVETTEDTAMQYAYKKSYLSEIDTALITLINKYAGEISDKDLDDLLDAAMDRDYRIDLLTDGLYLVFAD